MDKWKHDDLQHDLAGHLRATRDRVVWENMQMGPSGSPRPDVYTVPKTFTRFCPLAYEIKVSVADFRRDVTAGKWQSYLQFAAGVTFAVPAGLINKADVPPGCGLMVRGEGGWRTLKAPTLKALDGLPLKVWLKLIIDGIERQYREIQPRNLNEYRVQQQLTKKYGQTIAELLRQVAGAEERLKRELEYINERHQDVLKRTNDAHRRAIEDAKSARIQIDAERTLLAEALGLASDVSVWELTRAMAAARKALVRDDEIARLTNIINRVRDQVAA